MNPALLFLIRRSLVNRVRTTLGRLRRVRYLLPALVGVAYFVLIFGGPMRGRGGGDPAVPGAFPTGLAWGLTAALLASASITWLLPGKNPGLQFLESEVALLFPAPLSRRELVLYKLAAMQPPLLFSGLLMAAFTARGGPLRFAIVAVGAFLALNALSLHNVGAAFTHASLGAHGLAGWRRQWPVLAAMVGLAIAVGLLVPWPEGFDPGAWVAALDASPAAVLLYPVHCLARLPLSGDALTFLLHLGPALLVVAALAFWVLRADVAFEEAAAAHAEVLARRIAALRAGRLSDPSLSPSRKMQAPPWRLPPAGPAEGAFVWKAATALVRGSSVRFLAVVLLLAIVALAVVQGVTARAEGREVPLVSAVCAGFAVLAILMGPAVSPAGMRQDLDYMDLLKSLPVSGARLLRGEILGAAMPVMALQWLLVAVAIVAFPGEVIRFRGGTRIATGIPLAWVLGVGLSAALLLPALTLLSTALDAAMVVLFPGWMRPASGDARPAGTEALGQNILTFLGKGLALGIGGALAALLGGAVLAAGWFAGPAYLRPAAVAAGSTVAAAALVAECWLLCAWLGDRYDALDPAEEGLTA